MKDKNHLELSRGITGSQSVMDLSTNAVNCNNDNPNIPIDTLRSKRRLKKLISSSRKFSSFTSHSSLVSLANNSSDTTTKIVSKTLLEAIAIKLKSENIDLTEEPYSDNVSLSKKSQFKQYLIGFLMIGWFLRYSSSTNPKIYRRTAERHL